MHSIKKNAAYLTFSGYLLMPLTIISTILMRRWMDPYIFGVITTLNLFVMYSVFSSLGTLSAAEVKLPYYRGKGDIEHFEQIRSTTFSFTLLTGAIFSIGVACWVIARRSNLDEYIFMGLLVYCIYFFANQITSFYITLLRANHEFIFLSKFQFLSALVASLGNIFTVWLWGFKGFLVVAIIIVLSQIFFLVKHINYRPIFRISWFEIKILLVSGLPMLILGLSAQGMKTVDNFLVLKLFDVEQLGLYSIALMANSIVFSVTNSIANVLYPSMQEAFGKSGTLDSLRSYTIRPTLIIGALLPIMIGMLYFLVPMIVHWLIPKFIPGILSFKIIVLSTYFFAMVNMLTGYLISIGKQKSLILINASMLILIVGLSGFFNFFSWGLAGIALATGIGYFVCFVVVSIFVLRTWADWNQTIVFLKDTSLPFFYSLALILIIENFANLFLVVDAESFFGTMSQLSLFIVLYAPCILFLEKKTRLLSDFFIPIFRKPE